MMRSALVCVAIGVLVLAGSAPAQEASPEAPAHDSAGITRGVDEIAAPGVPGPIVCFSQSSFPIVVGREGDRTMLPVVAGAALGSGRVVAFGHTGYLDVETLRGGTTNLVANALRWAAGDKDVKAVKVGVVENAKLAEWVRGQGFECENLGEAWATRVDGCDVVIVGAHGLDDAEREALSARVRRGGGLIIAGLGWGWLQLNPGKVIREHPGNRLLVEAGLAFADGTLERTGDQGYLVAGQKIEPEVHALAALERVEEAARGRGVASQQASGALTAAVRVAPEKHEMLARCRKILAEFPGQLEPTPRTPIGRDKSVERVLVALQVELERQSRPERVKEHAAAAAFPGEVPADAPRVTRPVEFVPGVPGWQSTGLYAPAGESIVVKIPEGAATGGLTLRIGCHTDELWHLDRWSRVPDIARSTPLKGGVTRFASAFGGLVYLESGTKKRGEPITVEIEGVVDSPRFVLGRTTPEAWAASKMAPGPWGELETSKIIVSVPSAALRGLDDPDSLMKFWDAISDAHADLACIPRVGARPERFVPDVQISAGYMHSGYPIMTHLDAVDDMLTIATLKEGSWGLLHELGHNRQEDEWTFDGTVEVTCNLFSLHAIDTVCTPKAGERGHGGVDAPPSLEKYLAGGAKFEAWKRDPFLALHMYVQLEDAFGWETFKKVFTEYRGLARGERPKNDAEKRDQWMVRFSRACGKNLGPFFQAWGVPTSEAARASIAELPVWMPEGWPMR